MLNGNQTLENTRFSDLISETEREGYRDGREVSEWLEAAAKRQQELQVELQALQQESQKRNNEYAQRETERRHKLDAYQKMLAKE